MYNEGWDPRLDELLERFEALKDVTKRLCLLVRNLNEDVAALCVRVEAIEGSEEVFLNG